MMEQRAIKRHGLTRNRLSTLDYILFVLLTLMGLAIVLPFYNAIMISFVTEAEYFKTPFILFPKQPTLEAYRSLMKSGSILHGYGNTLIHIGIGLPLSMFVSFAMGYVLSRPAFPGRRLLFLFVLFTMLFSGGMVPSFLLIRSLGLMNTRMSVILSCLVSTYYIILMTNFIRSLPESLIESARLDGASEPQIRAEPAQDLLHGHQDGRDRRHHAADHVRVPVPAKVLRLRHHDRRGEGIRSRPQRRTPGDLILFDRDGTLMEFDATNPPILRIPAFSFCPNRRKYLPYTFMHWSITI